MNSTLEGPTGTITLLLDAWRDGQEDALHELVQAAACELRTLARRYFARERPNHTLQPTALVNEVYLRLRGQAAGDLENEAQFFAHAARLMREILVDYARARNTAKRGGSLQKEQLDLCHETPAPSALDPPLLLALDRALHNLDRIDPQLRETVEMRYFAGLTVSDIAEVHGVSQTTVERRWRTARRWLARELSGRRR